MGQQLNIIAVPQMFGCSAENYGTLLCSHFEKKPSVVLNTEEQLAAELKKRLGISD